MTPAELRAANRLGRAEHMEVREGGNDDVVGLDVEEPAGDIGVARRHQVDVERPPVPDPHRPGRATFSYGQPVKDGEVHTIWRRVGSHQIFTAP